MLNYVLQRPIFPPICVCVFGTQALHLYFFQWLNFVDIVSSLQPTEVFS